MGATPPFNPGTQNPPISAGTIAGTAVQSGCTKSGAGNRVGNAAIHSGCVESHRSRSPQERERYRREEKFRETAKQKQAFWRPTPPDPQPHPLLIPTIRRHSTTLHTPARARKIEATESGSATGKFACQRRQARPAGIAYLNLPVKPLLTFPSG